jgi:hypothetical protein
MRSDCDIELETGEPVENFLAELGNLYAQLLAGDSEVKGNIIYLSDYRARKCSLSEEFEDFLFSSEVFVYQRDEYENISRMDFYSILNSIDKNEKSPEIIEFISPTRKKENCEGLFQIDDVKLAYYTNGKLIVDTKGICHPVAEMFYDKWDSKLKYNKLAVIDIAVPPFE